MGVESPSKKEWFNNEYQDELNKSNISKELQLTKEKMKDEALTIKIY